MRVRPAFWIAFWVIAIPLIASTWIAREVEGTSGEVFPDYAVATFFILILAAPGGLMLGGLIALVAKLSHSTTGVRVGSGILAGTAVGVIGGAISCFASLATV